VRAIEKSSEKTAAPTYVKTAIIGSS